MLQKSEKISLAHTAPRIVSSDADPPDAVQPKRSSTKKIWGAPHASLKFACARGHGLAGHRWFRPVWAQEGRPPHAADRKRGGGGKPKPWPVLCCTVGLGPCQLSQAAYAFLTSTEMQVREAGGALPRARNLRSTETRGSVPVAAAACCCEEQRPPGSAQVRPFLSHLHAPHLWWCPRRTGACAITKTVQIRSKLW
jgi:hypothetical protein